MVNISDTIDHGTLERLVEAGEVSCASIVGRSGGWSVLVRKFETLVGYLKSIGIVTYQVDASGFDQVALKTDRKRTDAAARLKNAHEAASYDGWLAKEVQDAIDDPRPSVPQAQVEAEWKIEREALLQRAENAGS